MFQVDFQIDHKIIDIVRQLCFSELGWIIVCYDVKIKKISNYQGDYVSLRLVNT